MAIFPMTIVYDMTIHKIGCALLQPAYGCTIDNFTLQDFGIENWQLSPTPNMKKYLLKDQEQLDQAIKLTKQHNTRNYETPNHPLNRPDLSGANDLPGLGLKMIDMKLIIQMEFVKQICCKCNCVFMLPVDFRKNLLETKNTFYCYNGHPQCYGQSTTELLQAKVESLEKIVSNKVNRIVDLEAELAEATKPKRKAKRIL